MLVGRTAYQEVAMDAISHADALARWLQILDARFLTNQRIMGFMQKLYICVLATR
jgi:hypothetical protein